MAKKKVEEIKCYECDNALDVRTKVKVLRDKRFEWVCGSCYTKEIMDVNKKTTVIKDTIKDDTDTPEATIPFYEKGFIGGIKRYLYDDTLNDFNKIRDKSLNKTKKKKKQQI